MVLTITVTQDCNLRCFYCYEERSQDYLKTDDLGAIVARLGESMDRSPRRAVHVDWYGGEPLLNAAFIERASEELQQFVAGRGAGYTASIISNGTGWPEDPAAFVRRHAIREVQISFDGSKRQHDKYRAFRADTQASSFDDAVRVVDALAAVCKVSVRLNLDKKSAATMGEFLGFAVQRGWFLPPNRTVLQPARLAAFSAHSEFMKSWQFTVTEFEEVKAQIRLLVGDSVPLEEAETIDGFPRPKTSVCAALGGASFVVGADLREYRCGLQVGEAGRSVGSLRHRVRHLPVLNELAGQPDEAFWKSFDPTTRPRCSACSFLPVCWGGCPKRHLESDQHAIDEQGKYWRENLARLLAHGAGESMRDNGFIYDESDQLRVMPV